VRYGSGQELSDAETDHRRRLTAAMVEAASEHGYRGATVARIVKLAGVSRATFYEHFGCREECFEAAYREEIGRVRADIRAAAEAAVPRRRPDVVVDAVLGRLAGDRSTARFVLIEALAVPPGVRQEHERLILEVDGAVAGFLDAQDPSAAIQIPSTGLIAGVADVLARRALSGRTDELPRLRTDLARWLDCYRLPDGTRPLPQHRWRELGRFARLVPSGEPTEPALLPRGRDALPEKSAAGVRRQRILDATARLSREQGYAALTVSEIATAARVPRDAFYSLFTGKQEAAMAAQTRGLQGAMAAAAAEYSPPAPWPRRVWKMVRAFLTYLGEMPHYAHLDFVESYAAGAEAVRHRQQNHMVFALFLEDGYRWQPDAPRLPQACIEAISGAVLGLVRRLIVEGKTERILSLLPAAGYTILAPFIGPEEAAAQVEALAQAAR
jgi:AcrR family transcriptional regulator